MAKNNTLIRVLILLTLFIAVVWGAFSFWLQSLHKLGPLESEVTVIFTPGVSTGKIAQVLEAQNVIEDAFIFKVASRATLSDRIYKAGEYTFKPGVSVRGVMKKLAGGDVLQRQLTIPEGLTYREVRGIILAAEGLKGPPLEFSEGALLPETYDYRWGTERTELMRRMADAMTEAVTQAWQNRADNLPVSTPEELLILASIIEKETSLDEERREVAGVFVNRLRRGMKLQSDPTVIYGATNITDRIRTKHLREDHPYNTYVHKGLPPTPIANPGRASILAAANPAETDALFFVVDGNGGHVFSETYAEHKRHVAAMLERNKN